MVALETNKNICDFCTVRACAMCSHLSEHHMEELKKMMTPYFYKAGESIFLDQERNQGFATVRAGIVKLSKLLPDGREQIIGLHFPPDFIGLTFKKETQYFAKAITDVSICKFPNDSFQELLHKSPNLKHELFAATLEELELAREWMVVLGRKTALEKVATFLLMLSSRVQKMNHILGHSKPDNQFNMILSRLEVADFLGLTLETVSRQLSKLKAEKIISIEDNRICEVLNLDDLELMAGYETG